ncbi:hypothetical protein D0Z00_001182 [Geotrichum galactomycetum]|uniref:Uncharacterized protein n=1 Tax=Geotrichum galactomycetum TaxID=27317 RepID=A0ACB6V7V7_9ASCO|nr:hypothetical protein D0Z00_001182 [Geotrichum candidum]
MSTPTTDRLNALRKLFDKHDIDIYIVLTQDEHESEYTSDSDNRREFISGFTGSAGTAVITRDKAILATDGRYFLQAGRQLDKNWQLLKQGVPNVPTWQAWVVNEVIKTKATVGFDPQLFSYNEYQTLHELFKTNEVADSLIPVSPNLIDLVWNGDQPKRSESPVTILSLHYAGKSFTNKLLELRATIKKKRGHGFLVSALDDVAWLYNLRGDDIPFNPVFRAFSFVSATEAILYIDKVKITKEVLKYFGKDVQVKPYEDVFSDARQISLSVLGFNAKARSLAERKKVLVSTGISWALYDALGGKTNVAIIPSPVELSKSIKNPAELRGAKNCQIKDGVALIRYFAWLENELKVKGNKTITDYQGGLKAEEFRSEMEDFVGLSFETISSSGPNAAVIHYAPAPDSKFLIDIDQVYLCDSGGQYLDGTTDTTRTMHFGTPKQEEIDAYTLVLKGHIALASLVFPEGVNGYMIDVLARQPLWRKGLDYRHGTGHGVGSFLNVHEGPIGIGVKSTYSNTALSIGQILSNEPGYYKDGSFGIRIESVIAVKEVNTENNFGGKRYLGFETITRVPLCRELIDVSNLTEEEIAWVDEYHDIIYRDTVAYLSGDKLSKEWLIRQTKPLRDNNSL